jgi:hypothetical protein
MKQKFKEGQKVYFFYNVTGEILKGTIYLIHYDSVWISHGIYITLTEPFRTKKEAIAYKNTIQR